MKEKAILVGVVLPGARREQVTESLNELALLADTAGAEVVETILQDRSGIHPATLIGSGKVKEVARRALELETSMVIFDEDLSPVQLKNLEKEIKKKVVDRSGLILDIFAGRARTRESQIQVELAQLQYYYPRLTRQWTHLSRQDGGIGTRGPGETQLEVDRRLIQKKITKLEGDLRQIALQRNIRRKKRRDLKKISLVGYTNAGKSSLMNALTEADAFVENRLFATLDATIRSFQLDEHENALLIDTVGFIRKLPHHLVASFKSTLEETVDADILLHVVDVSHPNLWEQIGAVQSVLRELKVADKPTITVFNKVDAIEDRGVLSSLKAEHDPAVFTSATRSIGLETLKQAIIRVLKSTEEEIELRIPHQESRLIALVHERTHVLDQVVEEEVMILRVRGIPFMLRRLETMLEASHANSDR